MKKLRIAFLAMFAIALVSQSWAVPGDSARPTHIKGMTISGQVSADGNTLVTDDDNHWSVENPKMLNGFEGRYLTVTCQMDPSKRAIHVLSVEEQPAQKHAHLGDAAFRR